MISKQRSAVRWLILLVALLAALYLTIVVKYGRLGIHTRGS